MSTFELVAGLLLACALLTLAAKRANVPYPALLALAGVGLAFVPGLPAVTLDPELALVLFVAPVLLDAAYDASPRDLRDNWAPVGGLVLAAVALTVLAVAVVARLLVPAMPWAVAVALGAIVAPPDAAAATAVLRQLSPPHRLMVILEGESLLNDASALLVYRLAVGSAMAGTFSPWRALPVLLLTCAGGVVLGWGLARAFLLLAVRVRDRAISVVIQFLATFGVWIAADRLGASAVIATVAYALTLARRAPALFGPEHRRASYAVWEVAVFVLNALAFILVGLQVRSVAQRLRDGAAGYALFAGCVLGTVVLVRLAWVMAYNTVVRWKHRRFGAHMPRPMMLPSVASGLAISWCGMRGIVTLATALALPDGGGGAAAFPYRDLLLTASFGVVLGTLVLQGTTLRSLLLMLRLGDDGTVEREVGRARVETAKAAVLALSGQGGSGAALALRAEYEARLRSAVGAVGEAVPGGDAPAFPALLRTAIAAERRALADLRARDEIGEDAFHRIEEELDWAEVNAQRREPAR